MPQIAHYCQKCLAPNALGQDFCARCGTRLMIVVEPAAARYETGETGPSSEEHLLERISTLENRIARLTEKLERALDLLLRQAQNSYFDRTLMQALIDLLTENGVVQRQELERGWKDRCQKDAAEQQESARLELLRNRILSHASGGENREFGRLVNEGFVLLEEKQIELGMRCLERASESAQGNSMLLSFLGEQYFKDGNTRLAENYLDLAHAITPDDVRTTLLLGLVCADAGDHQRAKDLLSRATRLGGSSFAAHYGLGTLFAAEENWRRALREFKRALSSKASPEAHYVLGSLYYQLGRDSLALRHLNKAIEMDESYGAVFYLLGLIHQRAGQEELARTAFESAAARNFTKPTRRGTPDLGSASRLFGRSGKLLTGGDPRLAKALREEALKAFAH